MFNDETRVRQFLDEVKFLNNYNKDYDMSIVEHIKAGLTFDDVDKFLEAKRIVYNQAIVGLTQKYGIDTDDKIYYELDKIWNDNSSKDALLLLILKKLGETPEAKGDVKKMFFLGMSLGISMVLIATRNAVATKWGDYKQAVYNKMKEYGDNSKHAK